jgi:hypothetical protein
MNVSTHETKGGSFMSKLLSKSLFTILALTILSCGGGGGGGDGNNPMTPSDANVAGTWDALMTVTGGVQAPPGFQFTATFTLAQTGSSVTGTFATEGGLSGQISGSVSGTSINFTITQGEPCSGSFTGIGGVSGSGAQINGSYSGSDCNGSLSASFVANKR